jgi:uncharacterized membrane protein
MEEKNKLNIYNLTWYFILFSIFGMIVETLYCYVTTGVIESRQGLIWGPFCPVYGVGAVILIIALNKYKKNWLLLFILGVVFGSVVEYLLSYGLEAIYGIRFWEYSYITENLNGRICLPYSIFWGILSLIVMKIVKPVTDKIINLIPNKIGKKIEIIIVIFLVIDSLCTVWAIETCKSNVINSYNGVIQKTMEEKNYFEKTKTNIEEMLFPKEKVLKTFPNLRIRKDGEEIFIKDLI